MNMEDHKPGTLADYQTLRAAGLRMFRVQCEYDEENGKWNKTPGSAWSRVNKGIDQGCSPQEAFQYTNREWPEGLMGVIGCVPGDIGALVVDADDDKMDRAIPHQDTRLKDRTKLPVSPVMEVASQLELRPVLRHHTGSGAGEHYWFPIGNADTTDNTTKHTLSLIHI